MPPLLHKESWRQKGQIFKLEKSPENLWFRLGRRPAKGGYVAGDTVTDGDAEHAWVLPETYKRSAAATGSCSGDKPYRKTDLHCLKRDEIQTTLLKRNRGKCQQLSPLRYIHFSILLKSATRLFSHRIT